MGGSRNFSVSLKEKCTPRNRPQLSFRPQDLPDGTRVEIDIRAVRRLRESAEARAAIAPMVEALCRSDADLAATRVVCDWIQYKANFRDTVMVRPVIAADGHAVTTVEGYELAVDLRRCARPETDVAGEVVKKLIA